MKKSKEQKRKEASFRSLRGDLVTICRNFKSLLKYYTIENFDEPETQANFILEKNDFRSKFLILIQAFETFDEHLKRESFEGWVDMDEELKSLFIQTYKEISEEEKLFFSYF